MGDMADFYWDKADDIWFDEECSPSKNRKTVKVNVWTTREGKQIHVENMSTGHLKNSIKFMQRKEQTPDVLKWIEILTDELTSRGEKLDSF